MSAPASHPEPPDSGPGFPQTRWSLVLRARADDPKPAGAALQDLCRIYWPPIYGYLRRVGHSHQDAEDLTQGFLLSLIQNETLDRAVPERGHLRSFLLGALKRFIGHSIRHSQRLKRGGGAHWISLDALQADQHYQTILIDTLTPEHLFDRMWISTLVQNVLQELQMEMAAAGKADLFLALQPLLLEATTEEGTNTRLATQLNMSVGAVKVAVHRLRGRYRDLLLQHIRDTLDSPDSLADEVRYLMELAGRES
ncbi:MAG: RNA polymerase sigma factor [Verrucomicrobiales bacterium]